MSENYRSFSNLIQKITVYETKESLIVLGSDEKETIFRVLLISRNDRKGLVLQDEKRTFTLPEVKQYLQRLKEKEAQRNSKGSKVHFQRIGSGHSLAGFVRFTEGYYMIIVTQRTKVAMLGSHIIYKIQGTNMIYIPSDKVSRNEEQRYARLFENVDFSNNFYFSFTYDLTHTLQHNHTPIPKTNTNAQSPTEPGYPEARQEPALQFVWNDYLLEPLRGHIHDDWIVYLIHGFLSQLDMIVFGQHIYITLIARRSNQYAGTRFMKRGSNPKGFVANEVETEQIVHDASQTSLNGGAYTSFVQLRGSIPLFWSQDLTKAMSKPLISLDFSDPYGGISSLHFRSLLRRYGAPIIILSLVKRREKRKKESMLWEELVQSVQFLNQFMESENKIRYVAFDMARSNKKKGSNVLAHLDDITERCLEKTGFFIESCVGQQNQRQHGIIRTNCVDCLDRTNTAQFAIGKHALGHQLYALGVTPTTELLFDTDCIRMLETLYEDQGDTIALQYGGSNLVHRVQSYRKTDMITAHSNDILQTLSRYYSNSFSDAEKQQAFNIFLGVYRPYNEVTPLWDLMSDYYLHSRNQGQNRWSYADWVDNKVLASLPQPYNEHHKSFHVVTRDAPMSSMTFESVYRISELTTFDSHYAFSIRNSIKSFLPKGVNRIEPHALSPFEVRKTVRWTNILNQTPSSFGNRSFRDVESEFTASVRSLTFSTTSSSKEFGNSVFHTGTRTDDPDSSSSEESDIETQLSSGEEEEVDETPKQSSSYVSFQDLLVDPYLHYKVDLSHTNRISNKLYKHYEKLGEQLEPKEGKNMETSGPQMALLCKSIFPLDSEYEMIPPTVKKETKAFYKHMVTIGRQGAKSIPKANKMVYEEYVRQLTQ